MTKNKKLKRHITHKNGVVYQERCNLKCVDLQPYKDELMIAQKGCCAICKQPSYLVLDHCHKTGNTRELLRYSCNSALGLVDDNTHILAGMIQYLLKHHRR